MYCAFWSAAQWELLIKKCSFFGYEAFLPFRLCSTSAPLASPRAETPSGVSQLGLLPLLFPALQVVRSRRGWLGMHLVFCPGGASSPPGPASGVGLLLDFCLLRASTFSLRLLHRELAKGELLVRSGLFYARYTPRLTFTKE